MGVLHRIGVTRIDPSVNLSIGQDQGRVGRDLRIGHPVISAYGDAGEYRNQSGFGGRFGCCLLLRVCRIRWQPLLLLGTGTAICQHLLQRCQIRQFGMELLARVLSLERLRNGVVVRLPQRVIRLGQRLLDHHALGRFQHGDRLCNGICADLQAAPACLGETDAAGA